MHSDETFVQFLEATDESTGGAVRRAILANLADLADLAPNLDPIDPVDPSGSLGSVGPIGQNEGAKGPRLGQGRGQGRGAGEAPNGPGTRRVSLAGHTHRERGSFASPCARNGVAEV